MAAADVHTYRHTLTGLVSEMTEEAAEVFPEYLLKVEDDAKPYIEGMFKSGKVGDFKNTRAKEDKDAPSPEAAPSTSSIDPEAGATTTKA